MNNSLEEIFLNYLSSLDETLREHYLSEKKNWGRNIKYGRIAIAESQR